MYRLFIIILFSSSLFAQKNEEPTPYVFNIDTLKNTHYTFASASFPNNERTIASFLQKNIANLNSTNSSLQLVSYQESLAGKHYSYQQLIFGIPVFRSHVKVDILKNKQNIEVQALTFSESQIKGNVANAQFLFPEDNQLIAAFKKMMNHFEILQDEKGNLLYYFDHMTYAGKSDTSAVLSVFNPDPLTSAQVNYGGSFIDNNNASNNSLNQQLQWKKVNLKIDSDTFLLENDFYKISDFDAPFTTVVKSVKDTFSYDRSQSGFEDINAFYHVSNEQQYFNSLGFSNLVNKSLNIDPHAWSGAENSSFNEYSTPATLLFGEGGIDDAEDADVIIHEFGHFISANAVPLSNIGLARTAIDEGFGDYLASSYSKSISTYNWEKVFNWDGNNGTWQGRNSASTKHFPEDYKGNKWKDGEMWSSALMLLNADLGRALADSIIFQALYLQSSNMIMPDAAYHLLDADTALFNGTHHDIIYQRMMERGFFPSSDSTTNPYNEITIMNTNGFAKGEDLQIKLPYFSNGDIYLYDLSGKLIDHCTYTNQISINYFIENLASGIYIVEFTTVSDSKRIKVSRL